MRIHKEGRLTLLIVATVIVAISYAAIKITRNEYVIYLVLLVSVLAYAFTLFFFRFVSRVQISDDNAVIAPCDGKVVVIEPSSETEYLNKETIQVSIFMSPFDIHMNWFPVTGKILYKAMHKGNHLVAWAPKSSDVNERSTVVIDSDKGGPILVRQIAGAMARRVVCYANEGDYAEQNGHLGFIKFGSRVDLYLPKDAIIKVKLNERVKGTQTVIARFA
ncbi:MAG: phosphatidylserine decarboxylase family protein [Prolixibacteraceae bacterium]|nr:phosphatidylserine decarboxylase family protein [Prolixibacteraceae bacterium]MBN2648400.1 phosphatidylserine decarboxylase family protein [Prolixibacteraceae bacterium]